jgi:hypothetical protein
VAGGESHLEYPNLIRILWRSRARVLQFLCQETSPTLTEQCEEWNNAQHEAYLSNVSVAQLTRMSIKSYVTSMIQVKHVPHLFVQPFLQSSGSSSALLYIGVHPRFPLTSPPSRTGRTLGRTPFILYTWFVIEASTTKTLGPKALLFARIQVLRNSRSHD